MNDYTTSTTRAAHLAWCKGRALEYVAINDLQGAFASFQSDMTKHAETQNHVALELFSLLYFGGHLRDGEKMRDYIEGFN